MGEIKFRGKRLDDGEWIYGSLLWLDGLAYIMSSNDRGCAVHFMGRSIIEVDPKTVGQFTGLLDKSGREIYEGDVIHFSTGDKCQVRYEDGGFGYQLWSGFVPFSGHNWLQDILARCEVIGNIYDQPELLNPAKQEA